MFFSGKREVVLSDRLELRFERVRCRNGPVGRRRTEGAVTVIQPDVTHVGGITELRKITTMAEAFDVAVVPHCPLSPIAFAANLQVVFCSYNAVMQEQDLSLHDPTESVGLQYLNGPGTFEFDDGYVSRPTEPGLGIDVNESYVREQSRADVKWYNPVWRHEDGSIAEW
ncbi:enolase C-terminal domain-like protein [Halopiger xanaduensis]|uniref:enolase C-terminal domain-like protein n=1 Tax=Halopiger xanaduensis TaxID=387343 RepID=UPI002479CC32|nr:enolase C-terminal domain-like protein [Halopiger xanaduensis]